MAVRHAVALTLKLSTFPLRDGSNTTTGIPAGDGVARTFLSGCRTTDSPIAGLLPALGAPIVAATTAVMNTPAIVNRATREDVDVVMGSLFLSMVHDLG
ncbi:MAG: hypothetical protein NTU77_02605 [Actinobacteria bacterium]|nr:hypothetical protein [Actinomycetota bacterium]